MPNPHLLRLFKRYWRRRVVSTEVPNRPVLYSFSHCLTMMATNAAERLQMRLENQSMFSHTAHRCVEAELEGTNDDWNAGWVELTNGSCTEKLAS